jgi:putative protease
VFNTEKIWFVPISLIVEARNILIDKLTKTRELTFDKRTSHHSKTSHPYFAQSLDYHANIYNHKAEEFYRRHGVKQLSPAFEQQPPRNAELMRTKHCLKFSLNLCPKQKQQNSLSEPLFLINGNKKFQLNFDCRNCEMIITQP